MYDSQTFHEKLPSIKEYKILLLFAAPNYDNAVQKLDVFYGMDRLLYVYSNH
jgi:hypothetical protein